MQRPTHPGREPRPDRGCRQRLHPPAHHDHERAFSINPVASFTDTQILATFRQFLAETPAGLSDDLGNAPTYFPSRQAFERWRQRWLPYLAGMTDGPASAPEYARLRPVLMAGRIADRLDRFHVY